MFNSDFDPLERLNTLQEQQQSMAANMEQISLLLRNQTRYLEMLTTNYKQQAYELGQQRLYIQLLDQRIHELEKLK